MWLDIAVVVIFLLSTAQGLRKGFVQTFIHAIGWLLALVISYASYPFAASFLKDKTGLYDFLHLSILSRLSDGGSAESDSIINGLPLLLKSPIVAIQDSITATLATGLTDFLFNLMSFLLVALIVRAILLLLSSLLSKKRHGGVTGFVDGLFGLLAGAAKGILLNFVLLALLVPIISFSSGDAIMTALENSMIAKTLYDNNLLFLIIHDFL
ncbi:MAG: CvpA family protein [Eubacteriales bacterium]|nr:CvpA family protein [Eubacteriales bacterium]